MGRPSEGKASLMKRVELAGVMTSESLLLLPLCPGKQGYKSMVTIKTCRLSSEKSTMIQQKIGHLNSEKNGEFNKLLEPVG